MTTKPLQKFEKFPITHIKPNGWIKEFLNRQVKGLTGNIGVAGYPFNTNMWDGKTLNRHSSHESNEWWCSWWPYEQTSYYLDGAHRIGHLLNDEKLTTLVKNNFEYVLNNTKEDGRIGTNLSGEWWRWPYASFNRIYMTEYDVTKNEAYVQMLHKHYLSFTAEDFADDLEMANVEQLCWLYEQTGDEKLLEMAEEAYRLFNSDIKYRDRGNNDMVFDSPRVPDGHGVVYIELLKVPAILYNYTGKMKYWEDAMNGLNKMEQHFMLVSGLPSTTEHFTKRSDLSGHETCNTATFPYTYGYFLRISGDSTFADRIERATFNASMGSITKDFKSHQYFSAPNQINSTFDSNRFGYYNGFDTYLPGQKVECCTGNVNRFMPYYVEQMYLKSGDNGIVFSLYGPSQLETTINNEKVTVTQETNYPFTEDINFTFNMATALELTTTFRVPTWCKDVTVALNSEVIQAEINEGYASMTRTFNDNDVVTVTFKMSVEITEQTNNGLSVERGPLVYSLPIEAQEKIIPGYPKATKEFPAIERRPKSEWRYALSVDLLNADTCQLVETPNANYPWDLKDTPLKIKVPVQKVVNWQINEYFSEQLSTVIKTTPKLPQTVLTSNELEYVELVPYGATVLRMTIFPKSNATLDNYEDEKSTETVVY